MENEKKITPEELDVVVEEYLSGEHVNQEVLDKLMLDISESISKSVRCRTALQSQIMHITMGGPEHVQCGLMDSVASFLMLGMRLERYREKHKHDANELERMFNLNPDQEAK